MFYNVNVSVSATATATAISVTSPSRAASRRSRYTKRICKKEYSSEVAYNERNANLLRRTDETRKEHTKIGMYVHQFICGNVRNKKY